MPRQIEAEREAAPITGGTVHGAAGGAPKGNRNALKHRGFTAELLALRKEVHALAQMAREAMAAIE